jgi:aldehyde dehydrogenase (NAD+)
MTQTTAQRTAPGPLVALEPMLIGDLWVQAQSGDVLDSVDPSSGQAIARIPSGATVDVDSAVGAARRAFEGDYGSCASNTRRRLLEGLAGLIEANYDELRALDAVDMGQPVGMRPPEPTGVADVLRYFAGWTDKVTGETIPNSLPGEVLSLTLREPLGVVGAIIPWNGPLDAIMWKLGPALATGCTVVLKPAEDASLVALRLGRLILEAGFPPGTVNIVTGLGSTVGAAIAAHPGVDKVSFTGSTATGQAIIRAAAGNVKRLTLEMGGKAPDIIFADADLDKAVPGAGLGVFLNSGQVCCAGSRIFVQRPIYEEVCERLAAYARSLRVGPSLDPSTMIGPVVSARQLARVQSYLDSAGTEGARLVCGGTRLEDGELGRGFFVAPSVFADVDDGMRIAREEIFGPVASVLPFDTEDEVIARANNTTYGLGGGTWTRDVGRALRVARRLRTGTVWVNSYLLFDPAVPFGGYKMSGWGSDLGRPAIEAHLNTKSVWIHLS